MVNVTDSTCEWGLALTIDGCTRTLASFDQSAYNRNQILYCMLGMVLTVAAAYKYVVSVLRDAVHLQQHTFLLCVFASITFMLRGIDPISYGHFLPRAVTSFLSDSCTAAIYTLFIMSLTYWIALIQDGAESSMKPKHLKIIERIAIFVVWAFYIGCNATMFMNKGFGGAPPKVLIFGTAVILAGISIPFGIYGIQIVRRLEYINELQYQRSLHFNLSGSNEPILLGDNIVHKRARHTANLRRIIYLTEGISLVCIGAQVYIGVITSSDRKELQCANGVGCDDIKSQVAPLHICQYVAIWTILWMFRKIGRRGRSTQNTDQM